MCCGSWPARGAWSAPAWNPAPMSSSSSATTVSTLGHVRREGLHGPGERWVAVLKQQARQVGIYGSAGAAAGALAQACGKTTRNTG